MEIKLILSKTFQKSFVGGTMQLKYSTSFYCKSKTNSLEISENQVFSNFKDFKDTKRMQRETLKKMLLTRDLVGFNNTKGIQHTRNWRGMRGFVFLFDLTDKRVFFIFAHFNMTIVIATCLEKYKIVKKVFREVLIKCSQGSHSKWTIEFILSKY